MSTNITPEEKLNSAIEQFEILQENIDNFTKRELLEMASSIRNNCSSDKSIISECETNSSLSDKRKDLLDAIHIFQLKIIQECIHKYDDFSFSNFRVKDFYRAKLALSDMADEELSSNMFKEKETPLLLENIGEVKSHIKTLKRVSSDCKDGKYTVLIMGDFQSGKSTTLNAFCDGKNISAIGKGDATSAVLVSVTYSDTEYIRIRWRNKEELISVFEKIKQYLQDFDWENFDLDNNLSRKSLSAAIEDLRNSNKCPKVGEGDAKFLMLCSFILAFYGTKELEEKKSHLKSVSDVSNSTKFPDKGESIWEKSGINNFTIEQALFVFIERVECFIASSTLRDLNCTIVDSPGLFNSSYDTMVTEIAMQDAHAIMYILPYHKGIGEDVCKSLYTIKNNYADYHRKLFIVNNLICTDDNEFYDSNCRQIESMFGPKKHVFQYDAKLAYLTQLMNLYKLGLATSKDYASLLKVTKKGFSGVKKEIVYTSFDEAWLAHTKKYEDEIIGSSIDEILEISGFKSMTSALKQFIAKNESYAVVISNGLEPMRKELVTIENSLFRSYIESYISNHDDLVALWKRRIEIATAFQKHAKEETKERIFENQKGQSPLNERMADDEYSKLFTYDFYTKLIEEISGVLYDHKKDLLATKTLFKKDKTQFKKRFSELSFPWIKEKILELISSKIQYLIDNMEKGQDKTVGNMFSPVIDNLESELKEYWNSSFGKDKGVSMLDYFSLPRLLKLSVSTNNDQNTYDQNTLTQTDVSGTLLGGLIAQVSVIVAGIASAIAGYITLILCDPSGLSQLITATLLGITGIIVGLGVAFGGEGLIRDQFVEKLSKKLDANVRTHAIEESFKKIVRTHIDNTLNRYVNNLSVNINKMMNERDLALNPSSEKESNCFRAIELNIRLHNQIDSYDEYKNEFLTNEAI